MIDFNQITTFLFDLDNTLITFDEQAFLPIYGEHVYPYFIKEMPSYQDFIQLLLESIHAMVEEGPPDYSNNDKFAAYFGPRANLSSEEVLRRFISFYENEFDHLAKIMDPIPFARQLLELTSKHFSVVLATNPLFPKVATYKRLKWANIESPDIPWLEITVADYYSTAKPHLSYYEEVLMRIKKSPQECIMIGNDKINDMVAGKLGIKTFLVENDQIPNNKIITTDLDSINPDFPIDATGTLEDLYNKINSYINSNQT
jgi:FMN phosphatase YigB (HAD superfamily)